MQEGFIASLEITGKMAVFKGKFDAWQIGYKVSFAWKTTSRKGGNCQNQKDA